ncbi:plancitoxin-1-like [Amphiura filiformis]|uniref:plancitoxin-1-like n=1 Tax=Amphiura filiformis TaxID=82378 RepID=UPI003B20F0FA
MGLQAPVYVAALVLLVWGDVSFAGLSCMDKSGAPVDWFIVYKLPDDTSSKIERVKNGSAFLYMDVNSQAFEMSDVSLDNENQAIGFTLQQVYRNYKSQDLGYGMYNDEHPDGSESKTKGHTKGVVALDSSTGFWLVHSTPKFPNRGNGSYAWPDNARRNGQTFLCMTLNYDQFEEVGKQLRYTYPSTYDMKMPETLTSGLPSLVDGLNNKHVTQEPWNRTTVLKTKGGQQFLSFAKFTKFYADLYSSWVAPYLGSDLYTETWQDGAGKLPSCCNMTYKVLNVKESSISSMAIKETKDHSKWAVTTNSPNIKWACVGGINRQEHQSERGGGTVCVNLPNVWNAFHSAVTDWERCNNNPYE